MSVPFIVAIVCYSVSLFVTGRLVYWQRRLIAMQEAQIAGQAGIIAQLENRLRGYGGLS